MITIEHVTKKFGKKVVLNDISCQLESGVYGLLGPNGAGKTTLMRCMTNLYNVSNGKITFDGVSHKRKAFRKVGYLPQSFGLFKELTVQDSMRYFCNMKEIPKAKIEEEIDTCLKAVYLQDKKKVASGKLSGGMMRRVGVAQALLGNPDLIIFDEPTAGLDPEERMHFKDILSGMGKDCTIVISTHIVEDIEACCDYVIVMNHGKICCLETCDEIINRARGKVFCCKRGEEETLSAEYVIEKQFERNGEIYYRVLAQEPNSNMEMLEPTLEDGYLSIIRGI